MPAMLRFILAALFLAFTTAPAQQIILLKLDDVIARRVGTKPVSDRWQKVHDYLIAQGSKAPSESSPSRSKKTTRCIFSG